MWDFSKTTEHTAKKEYDCDAWPWIDNANLGEHDFSAEEWAVIEKARLEKFKILPGTRYRKTVGVWEGAFTVFRCRPDIDDICHDHEVYQE